MRQAKKYRERVKEVEALQFVGSTADLMQVVEWVKSQGYVWFEMFTPAPSRGISVDPATGFLAIKNNIDALEFAEKGDWLYKDVSGQIHPLSPDQFNAMFVAANPSEDPVTPVVADPAVKSAVDLSGVEEK